MAKLCCPFVDRVTFFDMIVGAWHRREPICFSVWGICFKWCSKSYSFFYVKVGVSLCCWLNFLYIGILSCVYALFTKIFYFVYLFLCFSLYAAHLEDGNFLVQVSIRKLNCRTGIDIQGASAHTDRSRWIDNQELDCFVGQCHWSEATCQLIRITSW